jgi:predicted nucleic acid-binding protein
MEAVERGEVSVTLDPIVLIELAYVLQRPDFAPQGKPPRTRQDVARYLLGFVAWPGIEMDDKALAASALMAWRAGQADSLTDCYLQVKAQAARGVVCADNVRHFPGGLRPSAVMAAARERQGSTGSTPPRPKTP